MSGGAYDVVVLRRNDFTIDGRVERQASSLAAKGLRVLVLAIGGNQLPTAERLDGYDLERLPIDLVRGVGALGGRLGTLAGTGWYYAAAIERIRRARPRVVHCHDLDTLWPGVRGARQVGAEIIYDSAELWTERNHGLHGARAWLDKQRYAAMESRLIVEASEVFTVSDGIADELAQRYGIRRPRLLRNVPRMPDANLERSLRERVGGDGPIVLHLGIVDMNRGLEEMVAALPRLPSAVRLVLMGPVREHTSEPLQQRARELGVAERVITLPPVPRDEIIAWASEADVGLCTFRPTCLSHVLAMPNKLYEYAFAGVRVVASELPDMSRFVRLWKLGTTCDPDDAGSIAGAIATVLDRPRPHVDRLRRALCWEREFETLWETYSDIIN